MIVSQDYYLEHFGVPGMRWGVRRRTSSQKVSGKVRETKRDIKEATNQRLLSGAKKVQGSIGKQNPTEAAKHKIALKGALKVAAILAVGNIAANKATFLGPQAKTGLRIATGMLAGKAGLTKIREIQDVDEFAGRLNRGAGR